MAWSVQLSDLRTMCQQRVDELQAQFVSNANANRMINLGIGALYAQIVEKFEDYYLTIGPVFPLVANQDTYPIPSDLYKLRGVELQLDATHFVSCPPYEFNERNDYNYFPVSAYISPAGTSIRYRYQGLTVRFIPLPSVGGFNARFQYIPTWTGTLVNDTDSFDFIQQGWEEYVVLFVASRILQISEQDNSQVEQMKALIISQIETWASDRDAGAAKRMTSNRYRDRWRGGWPGFL